MSASFLTLLSNAVNDFDGVRVAALFQNRQIDGPLAVHTHDVVLQGLRVFGFADIGNSNRRLPYHLERHLVDVGDAAQHAVGVDVVIQPPNLNVAGRQNDVRFANGPHHVHEA